MAIVCPSVKCPCASCAGERGRVERLAQGLPEKVTNPVFFQRWAALLPQERAS